MGSLAKGLRLLRAFDESHTELSLVELAARSGLDKSAVQRLANTLHIEGMLEKDPATRRYRPSHAWLELAYAYYWSDQLVGQAIPKLIDLVLPVRLDPVKRALQSPFAMKFFQVSTTSLLPAISDQQPGNHLRICWGVGRSFILHLLSGRR